MRRERNGWVMIVSVAGVLAASRASAWACSCVPPLSPQEELEQADAVFFGAVDRLEVQRDSHAPLTQLPEDKLATFSVVRVWKGLQQPSISVATALGRTACGVDFQVGQFYLVYAYTGVSGQEGYHTTSCTRTSAWGDAEQVDLKILGPGVAVRKDKLPGFEETE